MPKEPGKATEQTDADADDNEQSAFAKFEALTRKLVAVPKSEIDKLRNGTNGKRS